MSDENSHTSSLEICLVTSDVSGPIRTGGIGTAFVNLAETLASAGHNVVILYTTGQYTEDPEKPVSYWEAVFAKAGIAFIPLPEWAPDAPVLVNSQFVARSYRVYVWLQERKFDVIHFHDWLGSAYFACLAKHQGTGFLSTHLCVQAHSPTIWHRIHNGESVDDIDQLYTNFLEQRSVELSDHLVSPSKYMLQWYEQWSWQPPSSTCVIQNLLPLNAIARWPETATRSNRQPMPHLPADEINEIVFFGRLEIRKGFRLFCDAVKALPQELLDGKSITFLGKESLVEGKPSLEVLQDLMHGTEVEWKAITNLDSRKAVAYLQGPGRVAVIASLLENSPYVVLECLVFGVPFVATETGGTSELIHDDDRQHVTFATVTQSLTRKLTGILTEGAYIARPAQDPAETQRQWLAFHNRLSRQMPYKRPSGLTIGEKKGQDLPLVSICLVHLGPDDSLTEAIESLETQDYPHYEVILVDDGSGNSESHAYLEHLASKFRKPSWRVISRPASCPGIACNRSIKAARGEYVLFMRGEDVIREGGISQFMKVATHTGSDVVTSFVNRLPREQAAVERLLMPIGASAAIGVLNNCFGEGNGLIRRSVLTRLGGFSTDSSYDQQFWELLSKAVLGGYRLEVIPEALLSHRPTSRATRPQVPTELERWHSSRPFMSACDALAPLFLLAPGLQSRARELDREGMALEGKNRLLQEDKTALAANIRMLETEVAEWKKSYLAITNATTWKMTAPLRWLVEHLPGRSGAG